MQVLVLTSKSAAGWELQCHSPHVTAVLHVAEAVLRSPWFRSQFHPR